MSDVLLSFGAQNIKGDASKMLKDIQAAFSTEPVNVNVGLKVDGRSLSVFRNELTKIVNGITLTNGAPIKLRIDGVGEIESMQEGLDGVAKSADSMKESLSKMSLNDTKNALKKVAAEYLKINEVVGKYAKFKSGTDDGNYKALESQATAARKLQEDLQSGIVGYDDYINRLGTIKKEAAEAQRELVALSAEAAKASKPGVGEFSESQLNAKYKALSKAIAAKEKKLESFATANNDNYGDKDGYEKYIAQIRKLENLRESLKNNHPTSDAFEKDLAAINTELSALEKRLKVFSTSADPTKKLIAGTKEYESVLRSANNELDKTQANLKNWSAAKVGEAAKHFKELEESAKNLSKLISNVESGSITKGQADKELEGILSTSETARNGIKLLGKDTMSVGDKVKAMVGKFSSWFTVSQAVMLAADSAKKMVSTVIELDSAMTELKKVTDETDATYERFLDEAGGRAKEIGASLTDVVRATADFAKLGYGLSDASQLADTAIIYKNVADGIENISDASASIISTVKAFGLEAKDAMSVVDKFNEVSNNFAISSEGIGIAVQKSGAAMKAAGNDIDQTIALATAAMCYGRVCSNAC